VTQTAKSPTASATGPGQTVLRWLFAGPSGTGKTLAASVIARDPRRRPVPRKPGNGCQQVHRRNREEPGTVFKAAQRSGAVLLFDEADAIFGKRSEVRGAGLVRCPRAPQRTSRPTTARRGKRRTRSVSRPGISGDSGLTGTAPRRTTSDIHRCQSSTARISLFSQGKSSTRP